MGDRAFDRRVRHRRRQGARRRIGKLGTPAVLDQGYANQSQDFTPVVLAVKQSGADVLGTYFTFENDLGIFARQLRQLGVNIPWVGSPSVVAVSSTKLAGPALFGTYRRGRLRGRFQRRVEELRQGLSRRLQDRAGQPERLALRRHHHPVGGDQQGRLDRSRQNPRGDPGHSRNTAGAEGEYNFDQNGDGLHGYNIVRNEKGTIVYDKHIDFND